MGPMGGMGGLGGMPTLDPNMGLQGMMEQLMGGLGGASNEQSSREIAEKRKKEETVDRYDRYSHNVLCLLFVALLVFLPDRYDPMILNYSLSSDPWTFFIALEITLFSVFYGYKQYLHGQYEHNQARVESLYIEGANTMNEHPCTVLVRFRTMKWKEAGN